MALLRYLAAPGELPLDLANGPGSTSDGKRASDLMASQQRAALDRYPAVSYERPDSANGHVSGSELKGLSAWKDG